MKFWSALMVSALVPAPAWAVEGVTPARLGDLLFLSSVLVGVLAVLWALRERRTAREANTAIRTHTREAASARADLETLSDEGIGPAVIFDGEQIVRVSGGLANGRQLTKSEDLIGMILSDDRDLIRSVLSELLEEGTRFSRTFSAAQGGAIRLTGYPAGGFAVVRVKLMAGDDSAGVTASALSSESDIGDRRLEEMLNAAPFPAWRRDPEQDLVWVNAAYAKAVGADNPGAAVTGNIPLSVTGTGVNPYRLLDLARLAQSTGERQTIQAFAIVEGARRSFEIVEIPVGAATAGFAQDLTGLHDAESELKRHTQAHAETLDGLTTAVAIFGADKRLSFYNEAYVKLWQMDPTWLENGPSDGDVLESLRERRRLPEQADFRAWKESRLALYTNLIQAQEDLWHLPDDRMLRITVRPHPLGGVMQVYEDVTHQVTMERNYNALAGTHRATLDALSEGVAVFATNGKLTLFNPAYASIFDLPDNLLKTEPHVNEVVDFCRNVGGTEEQWMHVVSLITQLGGERARLADRITAFDGRVLDCASATLPDGAVMLTFHDVTATAEVERALIDRNEALAAADKLKAEFISHISYELRTPLNAITGFAEMLKSGIYGDLEDQQKQRVDDIHSSSRELLSLINNMLDLATAQAGQMILDIVKVSPRSLLDSVLALGRHRAEDREITIKISCSKSLPTIDGDIARLRQALFNVLNNAVRYTGKGGTITLSARTGEDGKIVLSVSDTGTGISPDLHEKVFGDFETRRGLGDSRAREDGAGLGLPLVKHIVELHGGSVELKSQPGKGTKVSLNLPATAVSTQAAE